MGLYILARLVYQLADVVLLADIGIFQIYWYQQICSLICANRKTYFKLKKCEV